MRRPATALSAAIVAAVVLAGCASGTTSHVTTTPSKSAGPPRMPGLLQGKYQAIAIAFPGRDTGIAAISGYAGESTTIRSWIERTTDGGGHWAASRPASGQHQPGAQGGLAFASAQQGWAYTPGLFFTRDGGATWEAEPTPFPLTGPVAVAGTSTWVVGYSCVRGDCPATIYTTDRVGGALRRLPDQPTATGSVVVMRRPTASVTWLLVAGPHGRSRLVMTSDAGRSWAARTLPCPANEQAGQLSAAGPASLWLICEGTPQAGSFPGVIYRTVDGGRTWTRIARENSLGVYAVSNRVAWAVQSDPSGSIIVRTIDGGRTWPTVLSRANTAVEAFMPQGPDGAHAVARVFSANGWRFVAYGTRDAGNTWQRTALPDMSADAAIHDAGVLAITFRNRCHYRSCAPSRRSGTPSALRECASGTLRIVILAPGLCGRGLGVGWHAGPLAGWQSAGHRACGTRRRSQAVIEGVDGWLGGRWRQAQLRRVPPA